jgi:hypothetical protein
MKNRPQLPIMPGYNNEMSQTLLSITSLGAIARQVLAQAQRATVWGVTSSGIFLYLSPDWVIFLSFEQFRGPLTLNSNLNPLLFQSLKPGSTVNLSPQTIHFDSLGIVVGIDSTAIWSTPARKAASTASLTGGCDRLKTIYQKVLAARGSALSGDLLSKSMIAASPDIPHISAALEKYLGLGAGLTPAGDDLVLGYLLAINRWGDLLYPDLEVGEINQTIRQAACRMTNTLGANLIECACLGQADERLILALDGILTGEPSPDTCVAHLLSWGHSSGANALTGMSVAIRAARARAIAPAVAQATL